MREIKFWIIIILALVIIIFVVILYKDKVKLNNKIEKDYDTDKKNTITLKVEPLDFKNNDFIPKKFTCDWENLFPKLKIEDIPSNSKTATVIVEDPDAPIAPFIHLIVANIPVNWNKLIINDLSLKEGILWKNDFWKIGWWWPCPPRWHWKHHYHFKIFVLDTNLPLNKGFDINILNKTLKQYKKHIIWYGEIVWLYQR